MISMETTEASIPSETNDQIRRAPDGGRGWVVVFSVLVFNIIYEGCSDSFGILYVHILEEFGDTKSNTAWCGSLFSSLPLLLSPMAGFITRKIGSRSATMAGGLIAAVGFAIGSYSTSLPMVVVFYGIAGGFGMSLPYFNSLMIVTDYFVKRLSLATGIAECGSGIGTLIFAPLTEYLVSKYGWRGALLIKSGIVSNVIVCGALSFPLKQNMRRRNHKNSNKPKKTGEGKTTKRDADMWRPYLKQLKNKTVLIFSISIVVTGFWYNVPFIFIVSFGVDIGVSFQKASYLLLIIGLVNVFGIVGCGILCNKTYVDNSLVFGISTGLCGVTLVLFPVFREYLPFTILSGCYGLFSASTEVLFPCILIETVGKEAYDNFFCVLIIFLEGAATLLGPPFAGFLVDYTGSYCVTFYTAGACVIATGCSYVILSRRRSKQTVKLSTCNIETINI